MCGRYVLKASGIELKRELNLEAEPVVTPRYNLAPMQAAPIVLDAHPAELTSLRWGLVPHWAKDEAIASSFINARVETVEDKAVYSALLDGHRCLVPCDGFYEWRREGRVRVPHYLHHGSGRVLTMAGLWTTWRGHGEPLSTFTIITTAARGPVAAIHERMPLFIAKGDREQWLHGPRSSLSALLRPPASPEELDVLQVGPAVNSVTKDDPSLLEPARVVQLPLL